MLDEELGEFQDEGVAILARGDGGAGVERAAAVDAQECCWRIDVRAGGAGPDEWSRGCLLIRPQAVFCEDSVVCVLAREVRVVARHGAVARPTEVDFQLGFVHASGCGEVGGARMAQAVRVWTLLDPRAREEGDEEFAQGWVQDGRGRAIPFGHPQGRVGVVAVGVEGEPRAQVRRARHDERGAFAGLTTHVQHISIFVFGNVLDLQVADFRDARARLPQRARERSIAWRATHCDETLRFVGRKEFAALQAPAILTAHVARDPGY